MPLFKPDMNRLCIMPLKRWCYPEFLGASIYAVSQWNGMARQLFAKSFDSIRKSLRVSQTGSSFPNAINNVKQSLNNFKSLVERQKKKSTKLYEKSRWKKYFLSKWVLLNKGRLTEWMFEKVEKKRIEIEIKIYNLSTTN